MKRFWLALLLASAALVADAAQEPSVLVFGDSLSTAYGLPQDSGWVRLLQQRLRDERPRVKVVNASVAGETTAGGRARIDDALRRHHPTIVVLALGGNDGLRGLAITQIRANLAYILRSSQREGAQALLVGIKLPPNYGRTYTQRLEATFKELAAEFNVPLVPFLLEGLGTDRKYFQSDGIHPSAEAQPILLDNVWPSLDRLLRERQRRN